MLPPPAQFASGVKKLGVGDGKKIICYDSVRACSQPRAAGGCSRSSAMMTWPCWTVACPSGSAKTAPSKMARPAAVQERHFTARNSAP
jgi:hypothetical protein